MFPLQRSLTSTATEESHYAFIGLVNLAIVAEEVDAVQDCNQKQNRHVGKIMWSIHTDTDKLTHPSRQTHTQKTTTKTHKYNELV